MRYDALYSVQTFSFAITARDNKQNYKMNLSATSEEWVIVLVFLQFRNYFVFS